jgi:hypothetical protein
VPHPQLTHSVSPCATYTSSAASVASAAPLATSARGGGSTCRVRRELRGDGEMARWQLDRPPFSPSNHSETSLHSNHPSSRTCSSRRWELADR